MNITTIPLSTDKIFDEAEARAMKAAKGRIDEAEARAAKAKARATKAEADLAAERSRAEAKVAESIRQMLKDKVPAESIISWLGVSEKQLEAVQRESAYS